MRIAKTLVSVLSASALALPILGAAACGDDNSARETMEEVEDEVRDTADEVEDEIDDRT